MKINHGSPVRVSHRKKKRDIIYRSKSRATSVDYMWRVGGMLDHYKEKHDINNPKVFFLLFIYSMESFLIKGVAKEYGRHWRYLWEKVVKPLIVVGLIDEVLYHGMQEDYFFQDDSQYKSGPGYTDTSKRRWGLSQKGRNVVADMYRFMSK